ncbi:MAG: pyrimidine/purine nucleoside phosphorylase [Elusimicrobia bacterium]|jgi:uncharacterized protein YaiE (UPF0345 family)|nr:pyrimidine/purine nucleoside phosphorylase [Elusimicrobiota bacterium]
MPSPEQLYPVTLQLKANVYFEGKVVSHSLTMDGKKKTVGVIYPGSFHFKTEAPERMDIVAGNCRVKTGGEPDWKTFTAGDHFVVAGKSSFDIVVEAGLTEYLCSFE